MTAAALAVYPMLVAGALAPLVAILAGLGLLSVLAGLLGRGRFVGAALFLLSAEYVVVEASGRAPAESVIAYAVGLVVFCELMLWRAELPRSASADRAVVAERLFVLAAVVLATALLATVALTGATVRLPGAFEAALLGATAAVALVAFPWLLLRRAAVGATQPVRFVSRR